MTSFPERQRLVELIGEALREGAGKQKACDEIGITLRTLQRWTVDGQLKEDGRPTAVRAAPANKLSEHEQAQVLAVCNQPEFASLPPGQIVPRLADEGRYLASESTFYRLLHQNDQLHHRGRAKAPSNSRALSTHHAHTANELWSWDITYMASGVRGLFYYLYMVVDLFSRNVVGWEVHECESGEYAAALIQRSVIAQKCLFKPLVLHSDNGAPMRSHTLAAKLDDLGITPSFSRPRVSNDNAFSESLFRTMKYCPQWPSQGFKTIDSARAWVQQFVKWYNTEHRHSKIGFVTPQQRHSGQDVEILAKRKDVYEKAKQENPQRWSRETRNWERINTVTLNPDDEVDQKQAA